MAMIPIHELLFKLSPPFKYVRELVTLKDNGTIVLNWVNQIPSKESTLPILIIVPGIGSENTDAYLISLAKAAKLRGYQCVIFNYRGMSGTPLTVTNLCLIKSVDSQTFNLNQHW